MVSILKLFIRLGLWLFCAEVNINNKNLLFTKGPLLILSNHPNSFLDAIIIGAYYKRRVFFLARGDAFNNPFHRFLLNQLNMIPVYRLREGKEYLHLNEYAFIQAAKLLENGEAVLIFIEGVCLNTHQLQPFKKGATRILEYAQKRNITPTVHITGIAFNQLRGIGKKVNIYITELKDWFIGENKGRLFFNNQVFTMLEKNIIIPPNTIQIKKTLFYYIHLPYYFFIYKFVDQKTKGTVFFDSVLFSLLFFSYPLFLGTIYLLLNGFKIHPIIIFTTLIAIPIGAKKTLHV